MAWLFERTIEAAAWVALVVSWASLVLALYWGYLFLGTAFATDFADPNYAALRDATKAAGAFVGFAVALGALACVDRFLFDADEIDVNG